MSISNKDAFLENLKLIKEGLETPNMSNEDLKSYLKFTLDAIGTLANVSYTSLEASNKLVEMIENINTLLKNHFKEHSQ